MVINQSREKKGNIVPGYLIKCCQNNLQLELGMAGLSDPSQQWVGPVFFASAHEVTTPNVNRLLALGLCGASQHTYIQSYDRRHHSQVLWHWQPSGEVLAKRGFGRNEACSC